MDHIENVLLENINKPGSLFIFPTNVAASQWADHLLRRMGGGTVAMEQFIAWDTFKQNSVRSKVQNKQSVPSALRKMFICRLIQENAELCRQDKTPVFVSLIRREWAQQAAVFASWITELLPQLGAWFTKTTGLAAALACGNDASHLAEKFKDDELDLFTLTLRYAQFLEAHGLFEPAWETPPFEDTGKECFIFFPESLSDYSEYRELLAASGHVKTICAGDCGLENKTSELFFYTNARSEITEAALYIRALHEREHVPWDSIAVSIPAVESYEPYLLREFANRNIPFVKRSGKPLSSYPAGQFFGAVTSCVSADFAFSPLAALLLNRHLPWKDSGDIQKLIDFGIKNNCITSWVEIDKGEEKPLNVWEDAFAKPFGGIHPSARRFFDDLKRRATALRRAGSFAGIRRAYFSFRERFFDMENCLPETDLVFSRCISELMYLADIEKSYPDVQTPDPYTFFVEYLGEVNYLAQQSASGVVILPYRTAAPAPFDCHVILGSSQENLSAVFSRMGFLPRGKRENLGLVDEDASGAFINLHKLNSRLPAAFFCSEQTFSGYAIPHSSLGLALKSRQRYGGEQEYREKFSDDLYQEESGFYLSSEYMLRRQRFGTSVKRKEAECSRGSGFQTGTDAAFPLRLHAVQKEGFAAWLSRRKQNAKKDEEWRADKTLLKLVRDRFCHNAQFENKFSVSASSLAPYFQCSLKWLFERVLGLENVVVATGLMAENIAGLVYHAILNLFFSELKKNNEILCARGDSSDGEKPFPVLPASYQGLLARSVESVFAAFPCLPPGDRPVMSSLTARLLLAEKKLFQASLSNFLAVFLSYFEGFRVAGSETSYYAERESFFLNGTVDCILEDAREFSENRGAALIVDFKTKNMPKRDLCTGMEPGGLADFQLPMYLSLAEEKEKKTVHTALFFSIVDAEPQVLFGVIQNILNKSVVPKKEEDRIMRDSDLFGRILNEFTKKAEQFASEIGSGRFTVFPSESEKCLDCAYNRVCRTVYKIDRKQLPCDKPFS